MAKDAKTVHPEAQLEQRSSDLRVPLDRTDLYAKMSLFAGLKPDVFEKFPGTGIVRRYRKGEVICRQGDAGWTAFYILSSEDALELIRGTLKTDLSGQKRAELAQDEAALQGFLGSTNDPTGTAQARTVASVYLSLARTASSGKKGWLGHLRDRLFGAPADRAATEPRAIPIDGPTDIDYQSLRAALREGELFGEMSCFYRTPRSATVVADRDCYMLEMLRNILDNLKKDKKFKDRLDKTYKERVLDLQMRNLALFKDLRKEQIQLLREKAELRSFRAGQVICDENDRSDEMFVIRSGLVKVVKNVSALFTAEDIRRWKNLKFQAEGAQAKVLQGLPENVQALIQSNHDGSALSESDRQAIAQAFNTIVKAGPLWKVKELEAAARDARFVEQLAELPDLPKDWPELQIRRLNRLMLELVLFGAPMLNRPPDVETVLAYASRGESIGEMGLMNGDPRSATCIAYVHPREGLARKEAAKQDEEVVETVHISQALFEELKQDDAFRRRVEEVIGTRRRSERAILEAPLTEAVRPVQHSEDFAKLGLIQGQRLMLIDLDRCTRCDECVRACVNTHADGRSRLFLDGPRFGQYLVPTTCRSCLDPVCMIGCPVGSIHRGDNGQIVIEDWCIGCNLCAKQCPYGSIQMHDIGIISEGAPGWRYRVADNKAGDAWTQTRFRDRAWTTADAPFRIGRDFKPQAYDFRLEFHIAGELLEGTDQFALELICPDPAALVWINGSEVKTEAKVKAGKRPFELSGNVLHGGRNVVAVWVSVPEGHTGPFFDLRLDAVHRPDLPANIAEQYVEKQVTEKAVVCDLCSGQYGQVPACVNACPHDAALRVNARVDFPTR
jgi:Fe-S-cluster-containing hydrogenase component 2/CRP-like cAMP-binding protein